MSLVPNATQTAPGAPIYAPVSGGGGGGGGSNFNSINVSSINFPSLGAPTQINFQPGVAVTNADTMRQTCASALTSYISIDPFGNDTPSSNAGILISGSNVASLELSCGGSTSAIELYGGGNYLSIDTCIPNAYRIQFCDSGVGANPGMSTIGTLAATAIGGFKMLDSNLSTWTLSLSSLNVSSINGAAPGGGGLPANIVCSTLGVVSAAIINGGITTQNLYTNGAGAAVSINTAPGAASGVISLETQTASGVAIGLSEQTGTSGFSLVCDTPGTYMSALGKFAMSNVSSINGAAYPPPAATNSQSVGLANNTGNQISVPGAGTPGVFQQCSQGYSVVAGNTYELHAVIDLSGAIDGRFDMVVYGAGIGGLPETVWSLPNDNTVKGQGVSCIFKPGNNGTVFVGATNTATNVSDNVLFTVGVANWVFTNLGAI